MIGVFITFPTVIKHADNSSGVEDRQACVFWLRNPGDIPSWQQELEVGAYTASMVRKQRFSQTQGEEKPKLDVV